MRALQGHGAPGYEGVRLFRIPSRFYEAKRREIQQRSRRENKEVLLPSCGLLAVCWLLESGAARHLNLVGFDHFSRAVSGRHHYWLKSQHQEPREHDGETEALMLAGYREQGRITYLS
jgi:hypothetical protein